jgi:8-oxo-dGTP pyrophosphatase MutT (NUDIX family)
MGKWQWEPRVLRYCRGVESGATNILPPDVYIASLARKRMAAGALFRDQDGQVLLVDPVYRATWDLPGGAVEAEESPHAACRREVAEELGLDRPAGRVLAVDWVPSRPERPEGLITVYDLAGERHPRRLSPAPAERQRHQGTAHGAVEAVMNAVRVLQRAQVTNGFFQRRACHTSSSPS